MRNATMAPAYVMLYRGMAEICRRCGYALAVHGSMSTDLDVIAVPWVEGPLSEAALIAELSSYLRRLDGQPPDAAGLVPEAKPHRRTTYLFNLEHGAQIDLSVMAPRY